MKKVLLRFYSANNLGDDLFVKIITERYKNPFTVFASVKNISLEKIKNLHVIRHSRLFFIILTVIGRLLSLRYIWLRWQAKRNDLLVYIGGSLFMEKHGIEPWRREEAFYKGYPLPYYIIGSNVGPYKHNAVLEVFGNIFKNAQDVCLRDKTSHDIFAPLDNVRNAPDVAFSLDTSDIKLSNEGIAIFSIIDCSYRFSPETAMQYEDAIKKMSIQLLEKGYKVIFMSFCSEQNDDEAIKRIWQKLDDNQKSRTEIYVYNNNLDEALSLIARSDIIVGTRFHAIILSLLFGKKVLPIAYSDKTINVLKDMNFQGPVLDLQKINKFDHSSVDFNSLQVNDVDEQIKLAELQFQELDKVLVKR